MAAGSRVKATTLVSEPAQGRFCQRFLSQHLFTSVLRGLNNHKGIHAPNLASCLVCVKASDGDLGIVFLECLRGNLYSLLQ
jgi:hypothetical protein